MNKKTLALSELLSIPSIGPQTLKALLAIEPDPTKILYSTAKDLQKWGFKENTINAINKRSKNIDITTKEKEYSSQGIRVISYFEDGYPEALKNINTAPLILYIRGSITKEDEVAIAVVGTRTPTKYGEAITEKLTRNLIENNITIVSGLARGIDAIAHKTALKEGGRTIAVLGSGLNSIYPPEHKTLAQDIIKQGAIISEYPPETKPQSYHFPQRNRIIAGLVKGVLITQASLKSGTQVTASWAAEFGREVFAVPGDITNIFSKGPHNLIKQGAKLTENIEDILEELNIAMVKKSKEPEKDDPVLILLKNGPMTIDAIANKLKVPLNELIAKITLLEISGTIKNIGDNTLIRVS